MVSPLKKFENSLLRKTLSTFWKIHTLHVEKNNVKFNFKVHKFCIFMKLVDSKTIETMSPPLLLPSHISPNSSVIYNLLSFSHFVHSWSYIIFIITSRHKPTNGTLFIGTNYTTLHTVYVVFRPLLDDCYSLVFFWPFTNTFLFNYSLLSSNSLLYIGWKLKPLISRQLPTHYCHTCALLYFGWKLKQSMPLWCCIENHL